MRQSKAYQYPDQNSVVNTFDKMPNNKKMSRHFFPAFVQIIYIMWAVVVFTTTNLDTKEKKTQ